CHGGAFARQRAGRAARTRCDHRRLLAQRGVPDRRDLRMAWRAGQGLRVARAGLCTERRRAHLHQGRPADEVAAVRSALRRVPAQAWAARMNLLDELRRRNVIRMAGLYLVGAWLLVQVAGTVLPWFNVSPSMLRTLVLLLALGFIPALVFAWVFELTPEGIKRDAEVKPEESIAPQTARRMDRMIIAFLAVALLYFAVDKFVLAPARQAAVADTTAQATPAV